MGSVHKIIVLLRLKGVADKLIFNSRILGVSFFHMLHGASGWCPSPASRRQDMATTWDTCHIRSSQSHHVDVLLALSGLWSEWNQKNRIFLNYFLLFFWLSSVCSPCSWSYSLSHNSVNDFLWISLVCSSFFLLINLLWEFCPFL